MWACISSACGCSMATCDAWSTTMAAERRCRGCERSWPDGKMARDHQRDTAWPVDRPMEGRSGCDLPHLVPLGGAAEELPLDPARDHGSGARDRGEQLRQRLPRLLAG